MKKIKYLLILILIVTNAYTTIIPTFSYGQKYQDPNIDDHSIPESLPNALARGITAGIAGGISLLLLGGVAGYYWYKYEYNTNIPFRRFHSDNMVSALPIDEEEIAQDVAQFGDTYEDDIMRTDNPMDAYAYQIIVQNYDGTHSVEKHMMHKNTYDETIKFSAFSSFTKLPIVGTLRPFINEIRFYSEDITEYTITHNEKSFKLLGLKNFAPNYFDTVENSLIFKHKNSRFYIMERGANKRMRRVYPSSSNIIYDFAVQNQDSNPYHLKTNKRVKFEQPINIERL